MKTIGLIRLLNTFFALALVLVLAASFWQQLSGRQVPCPYCILQRSMMLCVATGALFNLRFGVQIKHYALMLFSALLGAVIALVQISLHACPQFAQFGFRVLGLHLYTWAFLTFILSLFSTAVLLYLYEPEQSEKRALNKFSKTVLSLIIMASAMLTYLTYRQCGFGDCQGTVPSWMQKIAKKVKRTSDHSQGPNKLAGTKEQD